MAEVSGLEDGPLLPVKQVDTLPGKNASSRMTVAANFAMDALDDFVGYAAGMGHEGPALCVDASDGADWIVSGGKDCHAKVWKWDGQMCSCYRHFRDLPHDYPVTSVAFAGSAGPVVTVTQEGFLRVWALYEGARPPQRYTVAATMIRDVRVKRDKTGLLNTWILATAAGNEAKLLSASLIEDDHYDIKDVCTLNHDEEVLSAQHVPGDIREGAALATLAGCEVLLWNCRSEKLHTLRIGDEKLTCFTISPESSCWLVVGGLDKLYLWAMNNGRLLEAEDEDLFQATNMSEIPPLAQYEIPEGVRGVAMGRSSNRDNLLVVARADRKSEILHPSARNAEGCELVGDESTGKLVKTNPETVNIVEHIDLTTELCVRYDDDDKAAVLMASLEDGSVNILDLEGDDAGEVTADLRSLTKLERWLPVVMIFIGFFQFVTFAFGPATSWKDELATPARVTREIVILDLTFLITLHADIIYWSKTIAVLSFMALYVLATVTGLPEYLNTCEFEATRRVAINPSCCNRFHLGFVVFLRLGVSTWIWLQSTLLVVSMFQVCASAVDCNLDEKTGLKHISVAPQVLCYHGRHLQLCCVMAILVPLYVLVLIPHAIVDGDVNYAHKSMLFDVKNWKDKAIRKATTVHLGSVHPLNDSVFATLLVELWAKIALPCIVIETTQRPLFQTIAVSVVGLVMYINCLVCPPLVESWWCSLVQSSKLFTLCAMLCGVLTVVFPHRKSFTAICLGLASIFVFIATCFQVWRRSKNEHQRNESQSLEEPLTRPVDGGQPKGSNQLSDGSNLETTENSVVAALI